MIDITLKFEGLTQSEKDFYKDINAEFFKHKDAFLSPSTVRQVLNEIDRRNKGDRRNENIGGVEKADMVDFFKKSWHSARAYTGTETFHVCDPASVRMAVAF